ncbi:MULTISPECIES: GntR family transcriptional regulator [Dehalobacter]|jgi:GntR family transcriptional regulator|uniref:GntR family transcriptional regulator n=2 Tax=Dehalobacter restrictus TaxID=55583 RepID=A0A857DP69_9FIRM|nr:MULTISPECIES: GntR family transcriptional regulator [Dehalobacter]AHF11115.1 GntR family transcriptional regulator [Dehalobacter restrictus DSM 9455]MCG1024625.1 GntR family transcriptional regulator [Dehalobacter sp.]MDJ0305262.1 GntR family transcriptional regulator [Dehalobacter sp.]OCZ53977.1 GntR family transcriptional regulator [Dehalobacter sp. TeCB1]QHA01766.1 GntR family transcriptional regulator [Dehalobacter restrictus]
MNIIISHMSGEPIYQQIINQIKTLILAGDLTEGEMLPSIRQLGKDLRISVITTKRVYEELEREKFIYSVPGKGSFVALQNCEARIKNKRKQIEEMLKDVVKESRLLNLSLAEITEILKNVYDDMTPAK